MAAERRGRDLVLTPVGAAGSPAEGRVPRADEAPAAERLATVAELRRVRKSYGERVVLTDLSRAFGAGSLVAVVGRSGSGKTTMLHLLAGLERPTAGDVLVLSESLGGKDRRELAAFRGHNIALVAQEPGLVPHLSALENVMLTLSIRNGTAPSERATAALEDVGLEDRLDQRASTLSAGERQRVAIARALAADVMLLLVDEPTGRLDEENGRAVGYLLARAAAVRGLAIVCATHDPVLIELADEVVDLEQRAGA
jgi:putative ABC transport system ATP-binding protein